MGQTLSEPVVEKVSYFPLAPLPICLCLVFLPCPSPHIRRDCDAGGSRLRVPLGPVNINSAHHPLSPCQNRGQFRQSISYALLIECNLAESRFFS